MLLRDGAGKEARKGYWTSPAKLGVTTEQPAGFLINGGSDEDHMGISNNEATTAGL